jgi:hypothetical protein
MSETETGKAPIISPMLIGRVSPENCCDANNIINHDTNHAEKLKTRTAAKATAIAAP